MTEQLKHDWNFTLKALTNLGLDIDDLLLAANIPQDFLTGKNAYLSSQRWLDLLDEAVRRSGDKDLGLRLHLQVDISDLGPFGFAILNSDTLRDALTTLCRYSSLGDRFLQLNMTENAKQCELKAEYLGEPIHRTRTDCGTSFLLNLIRSCIGDDWSPLEIQVTYQKPIDLSAHRALIGAPIRFGSPENKFIILKSDLDAPMPTADPRLFSILRAELERMLEQVPILEGPDNALIAEVRAELVRVICHGTPKIEKMAARMNLSPRSFQRRLAEHELTFKGLVSSVRRQMAEYYLRSGDYSLSEISFMLGYSELTTFIRAFRQWTGQTPKRYLNSIIAKGV